MNWRKGRGAQRNSAVIWRFKRGKGQERTLSWQPRIAACDADGEILKTFTSCFVRNPNVVFQCHSQVMGEGLSGHSETQTVTAPPPQIFSSKPPFQLGAPWRLPSRQPLIMSLHEPRFARHIYRGESLREVFSFYTFTGGKEKSHHDNFFSLFFFFWLLFSGKIVRAGEKKRQGEKLGTLSSGRALCRSSFISPKFTSALILDFFLYNLFTFSRAGDSIDLVGRITKSEIVSCNTGSVTTCLTKGGSDSKRIFGGWLK